MQMQSTATTRPVVLPQDKIGMPPWLGLLLPPVLALAYFLTEALELQP